MSMAEVERLQKRPPRFFTDSTIAALTIGCIKIEGLLFKNEEGLSFGCEVFVKDTPDSKEWICYDCPDDAVVPTEENLLSILDRVVAANDLSYEECCFEKLDGKELVEIKKSKELVLQG